VAITFIDPREYRQLKSIERLTKTKIVRRQLPSSADILERQRELIKERLIKTLSNNKFAEYHTIVSDVAADGDYDFVDVAAAALKLSVEGFKEKEDVETSSNRFENTGGAPGMVRLFLNIGRSQKIRPEDIVRAFASEADIPGNIIGVINIYDRFTFIEVPEEVAERVISVMHRNTIKGLKVSVEPAKKGR
jgi:ATP-dependent RNA helicase DeaD